MKLNRQFIYRVLIYVLGLVFLAFSVAFAINSDLGISPVNSLPYAISLVSGAKLSTCVICVFSAYILLQIILLRKKFKWYNIFQIAFSTLFGYFTDFAKWVLGDFCFPTYLGQLGMLLISIVLIAIGISLYVDVQLIPMPSEGMTLAFSQIFPRIQFPKMKIIQDCVTVAISAALCFIFLHKLDGVREGTIISSLLVGMVIAFVQKFIKPAVNRICFPDFPAASSEKA